MSTKKGVVKAGNSTKVNGKAKMDLNGLVKRATKKGNGTVMDISQPMVVKPKAEAKPKVKAPCDRSAAAKKAWATSRDKIIAGIKKAMAAKKAAKLAAAPKAAKPAAVKVVKGNGKSKELIRREAKEAASVARFHAAEAKVFPGMDIAGLVKSVVNGNLKAK